MDAMTKKKLIFIILFSMIASPVFAETLDGALAQMLARNPSLQAARSNFEATYKSQFVTLADMLPQVTAYASETRSNTDAKNYRTGKVNPLANVGDHDTDGYGIQIQQQLFTSGKNLNAFRSKRAEIRSEQAKLAGTEQEIILRATTAYRDVLQNQAVLNLNRKNVEVLGKQLEAVQDRFQVGAVTRTDIAQSQAGLAAAKSTLLSAESGLMVARAVYREVIGVEPEGLEKPERLPRLPKSLDEAIQNARKGSPILKAAQESSTSGRYTSYSVIGSALPSVSITGTYAHEEDPSAALINNEIEVTSIVARLNVPLFLGGRSIAAISAANDVKQALKSNVHAASRAVERGVIVAWNNYRAATAVIEARAEQIKASGIALEGVRAENDLGTRTNLDLLNAEKTLLDARVGLVQAERGQYVAAYALLSSIGRLTSDQLGIKPADISSAPSDNEDASGGKDKS